MLYNIKNYFIIAGLVYYLCSVIKNKGDMFKFKLTVKFLVGSSSNICTADIEFNADGYIPASDMVSPHLINIYMDYPDEVLFLSVTLKMID